MGNVFGLMVGPTSHTILGFSRGVCSWLVGPGVTIPGAFARVVCVSPGVFLGEECSSSLMGKGHVGREGMFLGRGGGFEGTLAHVRILRGLLAKFLEIFSLVGDGLGVGEE